MIIDTSKNEEKNQEPNYQMLQVAFAAKISSFYNVMECYRGNNMNNRVQMK